MAVAVVATVVAVLMAPLLYSLIALAFDAINLVTPMPDLMGWLFHQVDLLSGRNVPASSFVEVGIVAALPGLALMGAVTLALRHVWTTSPLFNAGTLAGRPPDRAVLAEERLANVVEEMSISAGIPVPRIIIAPGGANAAASGRDREHVTIVAGEGLVVSLDREQLEGAVAHLIGSVANGDMSIGLRVTTTLALFGLVARAGLSFSDRAAFWDTVKLFRLLITPTSAASVALLGALADPFGGEGARRGASSQTDTGLTWREWVLMPLMGPVVISGFLCGFVTQFLLEPLVVLAWRQRKYMADATAVRLTRDPDALAGALAEIAGSEPIVPWTAHLAIGGKVRSGDGPLGGSLVPIFPSLQRREAALARMGAHVTLPARTRLPWLLVVILGVIVSIVTVLMALVVYLLVILSAALSGLFTIMPAGILHVVLRHFGQ